MSWHYSLLVMCLGVLLYAVVVLNEQHHHRDATLYQTCISAGYCSVCMDSSRTIDEVEAEFHRVCIARGMEGDQ